MSLPKCCEEAVGGSWGCRTHGHDNRRQLARLESADAIDDCVGTHDPLEVCPRCDDGNSKDLHVPAMPDEPRTEAGRQLIRDAKDSEVVDVGWVRAAVLAIEVEAHRKGYKHGYEAAKKEDPRSALRMVHMSGCPVAIGNTGHCTCTPVLVRT